VGKLYIVSTPIGNLKDITLRAMEVLGDVDLIACEDTRETRKLLNHYAIKAKTTSYHEHNKRQKTPLILKQLLSGKNCALVSDRGTPAISDPGFFLVRAAIEHNIEVVPVPGSSALLAALVVSGMPTDRFLFFGFLPKKKSARRKTIEEIDKTSATVVVYATARTLSDDLNELNELLGDRRAAIVREVTKLNEETIRGKLSELLRVVKDGEITLLGEFVLVIEGHADTGASQPEEIDYLLSALYSTPPVTVREGVTWLIDTLGLKRNHAYNVVTRFLADRDDQTGDT
jgi:16S rRNA (cytidine1402-2'-O)-methyltransferase